MVLRSAWELGSVTCESPKLFAFTVLTGGAVLTNTPLEILHGHCLAIPLDYPRGRKVSTEALAIEVESRWRRGI